MNRILHAQLSQAEQSERLTIETPGFIRIVERICIDPGNPTEPEQSAIRSAVGQSADLSAGAKEWWLALTGKEW